MFFNIFNDGRPLIIVVDVNGYKKGPNVYGRDTFCFQIINDNILPMGADGTKWDFSLCRRTVSHELQGVACMVNVMNGIDY